MQLWDSKHTLKRRSPLSLIYYYNVITEDLRLWNTGGFSNVFLTDITSYNWVGWLLLFACHSCYLIRIFNTDITFDITDMDGCYCFACHSCYLMHISDWYNFWYNQVGWMLLFWLSVILCIFLTDITFDITELDGCYCFACHGCYLMRISNTDITFNITKLDGCYCFACLMCISNTDITFNITELDSCYCFACLMCISNTDITFNITELDGCYCFGRYLMRCFLAGLDPTRQIYVLCTDTTRWVLWRPMYWHNRVSPMTCVEPSS